MERTEHRSVIRSVEHLLRLPNGSLSGSQPLSELPTWDSLAMIEFILLMDQDFGAEIAAEEVRKCKTVQDLAGLTEDKLASR